jgi:hypothetical protein
MQSKANKGEHQKGELFLLFPLIFNTLPRSFYLAALSTPPTCATP